MRNLKNEMLSVHVEMFIDEIRDQNHDNCYEPYADCKMVHYYSYDEFDNEIIIEHSEVEIDDKIVLTTDLRHRDEVIEACEEHFNNYNAMAADAKRAELSGK